MCSSCNKSSDHLILDTKFVFAHAGELGTSLQRLAAQRTAGLKPAHQYVPWVVVNGIPLLEDDENILRYICVAYTGRDRCVLLREYQLKTSCSCDVLLGFAAWHATMERRSLVIQNS